MKSTAMWLFVILSACGSMLAQSPYDLWLNNPWIYGPSELFSLIPGDVDVAHTDSCLVSFQKDGGVRLMAHREAKGVKGNLFQEIILSPRKKGGMAITFSTSPNLKLPPLVAEKCVKEIPKLDTFFQEWFRGWPSQPKPPSELYQRIIQIQVSAANIPSG